MVEEERQRIPRRNIYIYVNVIKHFVLSFTFFWKFSGRSKCFIEPKIIRKWKRYLLERGVVVVTRSKIRGKKKLHGVKNSSSIRTSQWSMRTIIFHRSCISLFFLLLLFSSPIRVDYQKRTIMHCDIPMEKKKYFFVRPTADVEIIPSREIRQTKRLEESRRSTN